MRRGMAVAWRSLFHAALVWCLGALALTAGEAPAPNEGAAASPEVEVSKVPALRVLSWNIQYGADDGEKTNGWPDRKHLLKDALLAERPELLCVQEALKNQVEYLEKLFPKYKRIGVGRDDGKDAGEFCAILYDPERLKEIESGTFWLSETPEQPSKCWSDRYNRICTWARFEDLLEQKRCLVFNTHWPQDSAARMKVARLFAKRFREETSNAPMLLAADLNCGPGAKEWKILNWAGLVNSESAAGQPFLSRTYQFGGVPISTIDGIFLGKGWSIRGHKVLDRAVNKQHPSDHFGIMALASLSGKAVKIETVDPKDLGFQDEDGRKVDPKRPAEKTEGKSGERK